MEAYILSTDVIKKTIIRNLFEADVLLASEINKYLIYLDTLDAKDLIASLMESHKLNDGVFDDHLSVDVNLISLN